MNADGPLRRRSSPAGVVSSRSAIWSIKAPVPPAQLLFMRMVRRFAFQENDFGVLAADVDEGRRLRMVTPDIGRRSHDLLNERDLRALRDAQPDRTGNRQTEQFVPEPLAQLRKDDGKSFPNTGIVTNIGRKQMLSWSSNTTTLSVVEPTSRPILLCFITKQYFTNTV